MALAVSHPDVTVETNNHAGMVVVYDPATVTPGAGTPGPVDYGVHGSGTEFPEGDTTVDMSVDDDMGGHATGSFVVHVVFAAVLTIDPPLLQWQLLRSDTKPRAEITS